MLAFFFPLVAVSGLGGLLFPLDFEVQRWKYGRSGHQTWGEMPTAMKVSFVLATLAGIGNWALLATR